MSTLLQGISRVCRLNVFAASRIPPFYLVKHQTPQFSSNIENYNIDKVDISDEEWRQRLTGKQHLVMRSRQTELAYSGEYVQFFPNDGYFCCRGCDNPLYSHKAKFESQLGYAAFDKCFENGVATEVDLTYDTPRLELVCMKCDSHIGLLYMDEGYERESFANARSNHRHCVNSLSIKYVDSDDAAHVVNSMREVVVHVVNHNDSDSDEDELLKDEAFDNDD